MTAGTQSQEDSPACLRFDKQLVVCGHLGANLRWIDGLMTPVDDCVVDPVPNGVRLGTPHGRCAPLSLSVKSGSGRPPQVSEYSPNVG